MASSPGQSIRLLFESTSPWSFFFVVVVVVIVVIVAVVVVFSFVSSSQDRYWSGRAVPGTRMERKEDGESSSVHYLYDE